MPTIEPTHFIKSVGDITPADLLQKTRRKVWGLTFDIDKTLTGHHDETVPERHLKVLYELQEAGFWIGLISNANKPSRQERVSHIAQHIAAELQLAKPLYALMSGQFDGRRKPAPDMFLQASIDAGLRPDEMGHVGDQLFKDIWGANRAGYGASILVAPYGKGDDWRVRLGQRPVEVLARVGMQLPPVGKAFPTTLRRPFEPMAAIGSYAVPLP